MLSSFFLDNLNESFRDDFQKVKWLVSLQVIPEILCRFELFTFVGYLEELDGVVVDKIQVEKKCITCGSY